MDVQTPEGSTGGNYSELNVYIPTATPIELFRIDQVTLEKAASEYAQRNGRKVWWCDHGYALGEDVKFAGVHPEKKTEEFLVKAGEPYCAKAGCTCKIYRPEGDIEISDGFFELKCAGGLTHRFNI